MKMTPNTRRYLELTIKLEEYHKKDPVMDMGIDRIIDSLLDEMDEIWYQLTDEEKEHIDRHLCA
jgi:hypothetical protein